MDLQIFIGLLLTVLPIFELRGGLPVIVEYAVRNGVSIWPWFVVVLILNILVILVIFFFFDVVHDLLMRVGWYRKFIGGLLKRTRKKVSGVEKKMKNLGFFALMIFVGIPLPGTGAWTGSFVAWVLGLDRWKSFLAIAGGVVIAGLLILLFSLGIFSWIY